VAQQQTTKRNSQEKSRTNAGNFNYTEGQKMNITISINKDGPPKKKAPAPLCERVDYAIECILCDVNKDKAVDFLQSAYIHLDSKPRQSKEDQVLLEKIQAATVRYGMKLSPNKKSEK